MTNKEINEIWKPVVGYEETHEVSNLGMVRRKMLHGKPVCRILSQSISKTGYHRVTLSGKEKVRILPVHRIVAGAFIRNPKNLPQVNHKNGNKSDNTAQNLEWVTSKENVEHSIRTGLRKPADTYSRTKIHKEMLCEIYGLRRLGFTYPAIGEILGIRPGTVAVRYRRNDYKTYYGEQEFESMIADYIERNKDKYTPFDRRKNGKGRWKPKRVIQMDKSGKILNRYASVGEAAKAIGVDLTAVSNNLRRKSKYCMGYKYVYE